MIGAELGLADGEGVLVGVAGCVQLAEPAQRQSQIVQAAGLWVPESRS